MNREGARGSALVITGSVSEPEECGNESNTNLPTTWGGQGGGLHLKAGPVLRSPFICLYKAESGYFGPIVDH